MVTVSTNDNELLIIYSKQDPKRCIADMHRSSMRSSAPSVAIFGWIDAQTRLV